MSVVLCNLVEMSHNWAIIIIFFETTSSLIKHHILFLLFSPTLLLSFDFHPFNKDWARKIFLKLCFLENQG